MNIARITLLFLALWATASPPAAAGEADDAVRAVETAFAATLAERDLEAFRAFLDPEVVFFSGPDTDRGAEAVVARWSAFFDGPDAPFSWAPETVEVLASGDLALSSGPVFGPDGERVATFTSIWRRNAAGEWKIVFDKGARHCPPP